MTEPRAWDFPVLGVLHSAASSFLLSPKDLVLL